MIAALQFLRSGRFMVYVFAIIVIAIAAYAWGSWQTSQHYRRIIAEHDVQQARAVSDAVQKIKTENEHLNESINAMAQDHANKVRDLESKARSWRKAAQNAPAYADNCRLDPERLRAWNAANRGIATP